MAKRNRTKSSKGIALADLGSALGQHIAETEAPHIPLSTDHGDTNIAANISLGDDFPREEVLDADGNVMHGFLDEEAHLPAPGDLADDAALAAEEQTNEVIHDLAGILGVPEEVVREAMEDDMVDPDALNATTVDDEQDPQTVGAEEVGSLEDALGDAAIQEVLSDILGDTLVHDDPADDEGDNFDPDAAASAAIEGDVVRDELGLDIGGGPSLGDEPEEPEEPARTPEQQAAHDEAMKIVPIVNPTVVSQPEPIKRASRIAPIAEQVLGILRQGSATVKDMAATLGTTERDIRLAIDRSRAKGEKIQRLGPNTFGFATVVPVKIAGAPTS